MEPDDRQLVEEASRGDAAAVQTLLARFLPDLRLFIERRAGRDLLLEESGADIAGSVCRELFEGLRDERIEYQGEREFKRWLYGAALLRIQGRRRRGQAGDAKAGTKTPGADARLGDERERLRAAIAELPGRYSEVVELAHLEGLSREAIATRLSITESSSRVLLARALARLATLAARREHHPPSSEG